MTYKGTLYGKIGGKYIPLDKSEEEQKIEVLNSALSWTVDLIRFMQKKGFDFTDVELMNINAIEKLIDTKLPH